MKRILLTCCLMLCFLVCTAHADPSEASAAGRIAFYHQSTSEEHLAAYPYNAIPCKSASFTVLGGNGCSIFAGLHAYQWLHGKFESLEEQTARAQEVVYLLRGDSPSVKGNGPSVSLDYARQQGARKYYGIENKQTSIARFFDETGGVLYLRSSGKSGGHFFVSVGYTRHEIDGRETFLLHIVDSGAAGTVRYFKAYDFSTFTPLVPDESWLPAQEYWMPLQEYVDIYYAAWLPPEAAAP